MNRMDLKTGLRKLVYPVLQKDGSYRHYQKGKTLAEDLKAIKDLCDKHGIPRQEQPVSVQLADSLNGDYGYVRVVVFSKGPSRRLASFKASVSRGPHKRKNAVAKVHSINQRTGRAKPLVVAALATARPSVVDIETLADITLVIKHCPYPDNLPSAPVSICKHRREPPRSSDSDRKFVHMEDGSTLPVRDLLLLLYAGRRVSDAEDIVAIKELCVKHGIPTADQPIEVRTLGGSKPTVLFSNGTTRCRTSFERSVVCGTYKPTRVLGDAFDINLRTETSAPLIAAEVALNKPCPNDIETLSDVALLLSHAPHPERIASQPLRVYRRWDAGVRPDRVPKWVDMLDGTTMSLAELLVRLYSESAPATWLLHGQPFDAETTLEACKINSSDSDRPYHLTDIELVREAAKDRECVYRVFCGLRDRWSEPATAQAARRGAAFFVNDLPVHYLCEDKASGWGGEIHFPNKRGTRGDTPPLTYTCSHGVSTTHQVGSFSRLALRPETACSVCAELRRAEQVNTGGCFTKALDTLDKDCWDDTAILYVMRGTVASTGLKIVKIGISTLDFEGRYGRKELESFTAMSPPEIYKLSATQAFYIESIIHTGFRADSLHMPEMPRGFITECYPAHVEPRLMSALAVLLGETTADLVTHRYALASYSLTTDDRVAYLASHSDTRILTSPTWSDYT